MASLTKITENELVSLRVLCDAAALHPPSSQLSGLLGSAASPQQIKVQSEDKLIGGR